MVALGLMFSGGATGLAMMWRVKSASGRVAGATAIVLGVVGAMWGRRARAGLAREQAHADEFCALQGREYRTKVEDLRDDFEIIGRALQNRTSCAAESR